MSDIAETSKEALKKAIETGLISERLQLVYKTIIHLGTPVADEVDHYTQRRYGFSGAWKAVSELVSRGAIVYGKKRTSEYSDYRGKECILTGIIRKPIPREFPRGFGKSIDAIIRKMDKAHLKDINKYRLLNLKNQAENEHKRRKAEGLC